MLFGEVNLSTTELLIAALEQKDRYTAFHSKAVQEMAEVIAKGMGVEIGYAGLLHDIGKLYVPDAVLRKTARLTKEEFEIVKQHPLHGYLVLLPISPELARIVLLTHERPDGRGYPFGVRQVPVESGIVALADTLHALVSDRPYRPRRRFDEAMTEIHQVNGAQLLPDVVEAIDQLEEHVRAVIERLESTPVQAGC